MEITELLELIKENQKTEFYLEGYKKIIDLAKIRGLDKSKYLGYFEVHHIKPRSEGGNDELDNLVLLTMSEHIIAHILLYLINKTYSSIRACSLMLNRSFNTSINVSLTESQLSLLSKVREEAIKSFFKKVVCISKKDNTILYIFESLTEAQNNGFSISHISQVLNKKRISCGGYFWKFLEEVKESTELNKYYNNIDNKTIPKPIIEDNKKTVVCYTDNFKVIKIYHPINSCTLDGFDEKQVHSALTRSKGRELVNMSQGYYWEDFDSFFEKT